MCVYPVIARSYSVLSARNWPSAISCWVLNIPEHLMWSNKSTFDTILFHKFANSVGWNCGSFSENNSSGKLCCACADSSFVPSVVASEQMCFTSIRWKWPSTSTEVSLYSLNKFSRPWSWLQRIIWWLPPTPLARNAFDYAWFEVTVQVEPVNRTSSTAFIIDYFCMFNMEFCQILSHHTKT